MVDHRPCGRTLRDRATPRRDRASLNEDRSRNATRRGGTPHALAILHQVIVLLEVVEDLADLIGLRVQPAHHLALLCQLMLTLLQGKYVQKPSTCSPSESSPDRRRLRRNSKAPAVAVADVHDAREAPTYG